MNLNEMLRQKAAKKLDEDIANYLQLIRENKLFKAFNNKIFRLDNNEAQTFHSFFWDNSTASKLIKEKFIDEYEAIETTTFMQKVENLQNNIEDLRNQS